MKLSVCQKTLTFGDKLIILELLQKKHNNSVFMFFEQAFLMNILWKTSSTLIVFHKMLQESPGMELNQKADLL